MGKNHFKFMKMMLFMLSFSEKETACMLKMLIQNSCHVKYHLYSKLSNFFLFFLVHFQGSIQKQWMLGSWSLIFTGLIKTKYTLFNHWLIFFPQHSTNCYWSDFFIFWFMDLPTFFLKIEKIYILQTFYFYFVLWHYDTCFFNFKTRSPRTTSVCFFYINC